MTTGVMYSEEEKQYRISKTHNDMIRKGSQDEKQRLQLSQITYYAVQ